MQTAVSIPGIHCPSCAALIQDISAEFPALKQADVNIGQKTVTLVHDDGFDLTAWSKEVEALGETYKVYVVSQ